MPPAQSDMRAWRTCLGTVILLFWTGQSPALDIQIQAGSIEHPSLPAPIRNVTLDCALSGPIDTPACQQGSLSAQFGEQRVEARFTASRQHSGALELSGESRLKHLNLSAESGRYASENLEARLQFELEAGESGIQSELRLDLPSGQGYVEPVFADFSQAPTSLHASLDIVGSQIDLELHDLEQQGLLKASGKFRVIDKQLQSARLDAQLPDLAAANQTYLQPFVLGTAWESIRAQGSGRIHLTAKSNALDTASLELTQSALALGDQAQLEGVDAQLHWSADAEAPPSTLEWKAARIARLPLEAAQAQLRLHPRGVSLRHPLRIGVASGALKLHQFSLRDAGRPEMQAELDAEIEPIELTELCRALGWPEFSGQLSGRLPGLRLADNELRLDGALRAEAFDGKISVSALRVLDPFGRVPRVVSDLSLRNLDLAALTGAFSFGRIEGRLDGDVKGLRLRRWKPVAFDARIATPPDDKSRHRISQRAIDNISSIGGGPTGLLSRGVLRFFDDFAYDRIGWSCVLREGICHMDGLGPSGDGGYVLVQGRWLPRIDVVGYSRRVDWDRFVQQVQQAVDSGGDIRVR